MSSYTYSHPIPEPPRTPTPPPDDSPPTDFSGLGLDGMGDLLSPTKALYDPSALSPMTENFAVNRYYSSPSLALSGGPPLSPTSPNSLYSSVSGDSNGSRDGELGHGGKGPFNFQPISLAKSPITKSVRCEYGDRGIFYKA